MSQHYEAYKILENNASSALSKFELPEFSTEGEGVVFNNIALIQRQRKKLIKIAMQIRSLQRLISDKVYEQKLLRDNIVNEHAPKLIGFKTKEERESAINSRTLVSVSLEDNYIELEKLLDKLLLDINIAITECQKEFDSYELVYNFSRLNSMGYLLAQANHKLSNS